MNTIINPFRSLMAKLVLAFLIVSLTDAVVAAIFVYSTTQQDFNKLVIERAQNTFVTQAQAYYQIHGSWEGIQDAFLPINSPQQPYDRRDIPPFVLVDANNIIIMGGPPYRPNTLFTGQQRSTSTKAVVVNNATVGMVYFVGTIPPLSPQEQAYSERTNTALILGATIAAICALLLGIMLARSLTQRVRELTQALHSVAEGQTQPLVPVRGHDEFSQLAAAFNQMSRDLDQARQQRRQMTADIAHDLRTPITVLLGYLESFRDGTVQGTPERFAVLYEEAHHLHRLVEDLRTLSLADARELPLIYSEVALAPLLNRVTAFHQLATDANHIHLIHTVTPTDLMVHCDEGRLLQILNNLISNALRYTPANGSITLTAHKSGNETQLHISDTGIGIESDKLPYIFDRFYRADVSRSQSHGESGLGLAIARAITEAHGGTISVISEIGKGTTFTLTLPSNII